MTSKDSSTGSKAPGDVDHHRRESAPVRLRDFVTGHEPARRWLEEALESEDEVGVALATLLAFVRIGTDPRVFERPMPVSDACAIVAGWLARPNVGIVQPTGRHFELVAEIGRRGQARGPLLMDAHVAALAIEHGATLCTTDRDFARFPGLRIGDPVAS